MVIVPFPVGSNMLNIVLTSLDVKKVVGAPAASPSWISLRTLSRKAFGSSGLLYTSLVPRSWKSSRTFFSFR